jgi:putative peptide zinc metalloprotease protein
MVGDVITVVALPPLREEVHCLPGPLQFDGSPSWTLHDPANNRFFRIGWAEHEMLLRWALAEPQRIAEQMTAETTLTVSTEDVEQFALFLNQHQLLYPASEQAISRLRQQVNARRKNWANWLLHNYLFFKIPLFHPDALLAWLYPRVAWIYSLRFALIVLVCALFGVFWVVRRWEEFISTFPHFLNWQGLSQYFAALVFAKILHEFGHALTAHRYGCRVPTMGVAFMVMYPMLYTDANETWKLTKRHQRVAIAGAGIATELILAVFATLAWSFLDDGPLRSAVFLLASSTWIMTLAINLSPFMRFDGYYLLADGLKIENLQPRAFAYNLWLLRRLLFGLEAQPPERVPPRVARFFIVYAWATWLYRFFLFLGISWMVYHFFFKLLGIFLMAVEIGWFIVRPIWQEIRDWPGLADRRSGLRMAGLTLLIAAIVLVPWRQQLELPALLKPAHYAELYLPYPAKLEQWHVRLGDRVAVDQALVTLDSSDLTFKAHSAGLESDTLAWQVSYQAMERDHIKQRQIQLRQWESAQAKQAGFHRQLNQLRIQAPLNSIVREINEQAPAGQWLKAGEPLLTVADVDNWQVEAFVNEQEIALVRMEAEGWFYPENPDLAAVRCRLQKLDSANTANLSPLMSSVYGGPIAARALAEGKSVPEQAQYRLTLAVSDFNQKDFAPSLLRGTLKLDTESSSLAMSLWRKILASLRREMGF